MWAIGIERTGVMNGTNTSVSFDFALKEAMEKADINRKYLRTRDAFRFMVKNYGQKNGLKATINLLLDYGCSVAEIEDLGFDTEDIKYVQKLNSLRDEDANGGFVQMSLAIS